MAHLDRVVVLVDMDCFYCQVEENLNPELKGKPIAVVQYNAWRGGGLIAVNYPARDNGVTRHMRGDEAKEKCPDIELVRVPTVRGKADLTKYREGGKRVADVLKTFTPLLQRASIDEAYLDITEAVKDRLANINKNITIEDVSHTYVVDCTTEDFIKNVYSNDFNHEQNLRLLIGGVIVEEIRQAVYDRTGYRCSAGIAHNKILAKLACGMNKPNKQTILPHDRVESLYKTLPIKKIKSLGGKFGHTLSEDLNIKFMSELSQFSEKELSKKYDEKTASWLYNIARGIDTEPVETRLISKSIGCCKRFPGKTALLSLEDVRHWMSELSEEIAERLEEDLDENNRKAKQIVVSFAQEVNRKDVHSSRTQTLNSYDAKRIMEDAVGMLRKFTEKPDGSFHIKFLGLSAGKFEPLKKVNDISTLFKQMNRDSNKKEMGETNDKPTTDNFDTELSDELKDVKGKKLKSKNNCLMNFLNNRKNNSSEETVKKPDDKININETDMVDSDDSKQFPSVEKNNSQLELSLVDIEKDADESLDFMDYPGSKRDDSEFFSTTTTEADYIELLKTMKEYPHRADESNETIEKDSALNVDERLKELRTPCQENEVSGGSNNLSPIIEQTASGSSFIVRYFKQFATPSSSHNILHNNEVEEDQDETGNNTESSINTYNSDYSTSIQDSDNKGNEEASESKNKKTNDQFDLIEVVNDDNKDNTDSLNSSDSAYDETCPECNEKVPKSQLISHMDEHMAKKLMEEEKRHFKQELEINRLKKLNEQKSPTKKKMIPTSKSTKRKLERSGMISSFFRSRPEVTDTTGMETCPECNKQIGLDEFASHLDFHTAKKLHLELNPVKTSISNTYKVEVSGSKTKSNSSHGKTDSKSGSKKLKNCNVQTVSSFFKKV